VGTTPQPHLIDASDALGADDRRSFLKKVAVGGAVVAVGTQIGPLRAFAQEGGGGGEEEVELTLDQELLSFLAGVAHAASLSFRAATGDEPEEDEEEDTEAEEPTTPLPEISVVPLAEPIVEVLREFGAQHAGQAAGLGSLLPEPVAVPNATLLVEVRSQLDGAADQTAVLGVLRDLDERIAATHLAALAQLGDVNDAKVVAAALPVVGQQAVVLGSLATPPVEIDALVPVEQSTEGALTPEAYPVELTGTTLPAGDVPPSDVGGDDTETTTSAPAGGDGAEAGASTTQPSTGSGTETDTGATDESEG
jgi:hypothetical protein